MFISFTHPTYLMFLFAIPVLIFFHFFGLKNIRGRSLKFANFEAIARVKGIDLYSKNIFALLLNILFIVLLVFAVSGLSLHTELSASSFSFAIAIDSSQSMSTSDLAPNRLEAAKETAKDFVNSLPSDSYVSVLSFAGDAQIEQVLTKNKLDLKYAIGNIKINPIGGTDILDAISNSIKVLDGEERKSIILLSDGQINVGNINDAINEANSNGVVINSLGIGSVIGGEVSYGMSKLDEDTLKSLAHNTGGEYFNVQNKQEMQESFNEIVEETQREGIIDLTFYLIIACLILFLVKQFLLSINKIVL